MADCNNDCANCSVNCDERKTQSGFLSKQNEMTHIRKIVGVVSGKGGVGKSMVTSMLACALTRAGKRVGIMDADITGPSIPKSFGITEKIVSDGTYLYPEKSATGIEVVSMNLLLQNASDPVVWRGPVIAGAVKQFYTDVAWGVLDVLLVDMPPGTGDVPLTVFQSLPVDGIIVVTSPQELVSMIVGKAVHMAEMMNIPVLGLVENLSYFECPVCGTRHSVLGESRIDDLAKSYGIETVAKMPIDPAIAKAADDGMIELVSVEPLEAVTEKLSGLLEPEA
ncbi:MAG: Mrp/NBP35 family ATP-binding protein [Lachnospiraceae bacterium]|nr:Mrp/NBP35 family ATP-binding protein [Lachnospiraceae bacterium]